MSIEEENPYANDLHNIDHISIDNDISYFKILSLNFLHYLLHILKLPFFICALYEIFKLDEGAKNTSFLSSISESLPIDLTKIDSNIVNFILNTTSSVVLFFIVFISVFYLLSLDTKIKKHEIYKNIGFTYTYKESFYFIRKIFLYTIDKILSISLICLFFIIAYDIFIFFNDTRNLFDVTEYPFMHSLAISLIIIPIILLHPKFFLLYSFKLLNIKEIVFEKKICRFWNGTYAFIIIIISLLTYYQITYFPQEDSLYFSFFIGSFTFISTSFIHYFFIRYFIIKNIDSN